MHSGHRRTRRRKKSIRIAPLSRSQSLDVTVTAASPSSAAHCNQRKAISRDGYSYSDSLENARGKNTLTDTMYSHSDSLENPRGPHLPPLGHNKGRQRSRLESPLQHSSGTKSCEVASTAARKPRGMSSTLVQVDPYLPKADPYRPKTDPYRPKTDPYLPKANPYQPKADPYRSKADPYRGGAGWTDVADVFVQPGRSAGIAFQWTETPTTAGLSVLAVTEGSLAAKHGGVGPGMLLVEVSRQRVHEMGQDEVMRVVQAAASKPRVLTLARIVVSQQSIVRRIPGNLEEVQPEEDATLRKLDGFVALSSFPAAATASSVSEATATGTPNGYVSKTAMGQPASYRSPSSDGDLLNLGPKSSTPIYNDGDTSRVSDASRVSSSSSTATSSPRAAHSTATILSTHATYPSANNIHSGWGAHRLPSQEERTLPLRFVGSRGNVALYDRDHILGLRNRDIEFVPTGSRTRAQKVNSKRSLGELTRDWRNDPCSTPARRRRLINDACKAIVRSYTWASVARVAELRREEAFAARIQGAARMWSAQKLARGKLAERRQEAALTLQCGWLSGLARRRVAGLREDRDHAIRVERRKILNREAQKRRRREELRMKAEQDKVDREERWQELEAVAVLLQRKVRAAQECRTLRQAEELREQERASKILCATTRVQTAFRRRRRRRQIKEQRSRTELLDKKKAREKAHAASSRIQRAWRRHRATTVLDRRKRGEREFPPPSPLSSVLPDGNHSERLSVQTGNRMTTQESMPETYGDHPEIIGARSEEQQSDRDESSRGKWSALTPPRATAMATAIAWEGLAAVAATTAAAAITGGDRFPKASDTAKESASSRAAAGRLPPAGMMTVRVRRGSEETSVVTPIVLTESGAAASEAATDGKEVNPDLDYQNQRRAKPWAVQAGSPNGGTAIPMSGSSCSIVSTQSLSRHGVQLTEKTHGKKGAEVDTQVASTAELTATYRRKHQAGDARSKFLASAAVAASRSGEKSAISQAGKASTVRPWSALAAAKPWAGPDETKPEAEQFFMEDSQVYLGCTNCGVKYLVEAVDPGLSQSAKDQPVPEVLYLCTTCGGTLQSDEDGRWCRRRRPTSAPPAAGRRDTFFDRTRNIWQADESEMEDSSSVTAGGRDAGVGREAASKGAMSRRLAGWGEGPAKLKYAPCARIIQHAYRDFRHRQYLRDWASAMLGRWLLDRSRARHRSHRRLAFRRSVVIIQSAARAASARARVSTLRVARLRFWMDRVAGLLSTNFNDDDDDLSPSPVAVRLLLELNPASPTPPPPPPPPPPPRPPPTPPTLTPPKSPPPPPPPPSLVKSTPPPSVELTSPPPIESASSRSSTNNPSIRSGGDRIGTVKSEGCALARALAPRMGTSPPGCPTAHEVDWGQSVVKLTLAFPPCNRGQSVVECVADSGYG